MTPPVEVSGAAQSDAPRASGDHPQNATFSGMTGIRSSALSGDTPNGDEEVDASSAMLSARAGMNPGRVLRSRRGGRAPRASGDEPRWT